MRSKGQIQMLFFTKLGQILVLWIYHFMCLGMVLLMRFLNIVNINAMIKDQLEVKVIFLW